MDKRELETLHLNNKMAEDSSEALLDRFDAMKRATDAIRQAYLEGLPEGDELPADFEQAVNYTTNVLYRIGGIVHNQEDATRTLLLDLEQQLKKKDNWVPETTEQFDLVEELLLLGSRLAIADKEPAYKTHQNGRNFEFFDPYDTTYNKFGILVYPEDNLK